jgi:hypothetical protein
VLNCAWPPSEALLDQGSAGLRAPVFDRSTSPCHVFFALPRFFRPAMSFLCSCWLHTGQGPRSSGCLLPTAIHVVCWRSRLSQHSLCALDDRPTLRPSYREPLTTWLRQANPPLCLPSSESRQNPITRTPREAKERLSHWPSQLLLPSAVIGSGVSAPLAAPQLWER